MFYDLFPVEEKTKYPTEYKIVCAGADEKVVGLHILGDGSSEVRLLIPLPCPRANNLVDAPRFRCSHEDGCDQEGL
jgi:hypothetical protein